MNRNLIQFRILIISISIILLFPGCKKNNMGIDTEFFIDMAKREDCSNIRNNLYLINNNLVLYIRQGSCPDNSYRITLYLEKVDNIICEQSDNIAGPILIINDESYRSMFKTILDNQNKADLGLNSDYEVSEIFF